ncbi:hypothetical protein F4604DRAFT_1046954 [Suillus subluteus]|nr:hypothetical protein F4604DRAFT_1046954 [Suillus subluteus]
MVLLASTVIFYSLFLETSLGLNVGLSRMAKQLILGLSQITLLFSTREAPQRITKVSTSIWIKTRTCDCQYKNPPIS